MTVYIDILVLENFILNLIILYATGIISKNKIKHLNLILGSLAGSIGTIIYYLIPTLDYYNIIIKILLSVLMIYISYKPDCFKQMVRKIIFFYLTSFTFGGAAIAAIYIVNTEKINIQNGLIIGNYTLKTVIIGIIIAFMIIVLAFKLVKNKFSKKDLICNINITINQKNINTRALLDTGNCLKEPITNIPVVIVEKELLKNIIPEEILLNSEKILGGDLSYISEKDKIEYMPRLKVIPFSSIGKENGMLLGIKADKIEVEKQNEVNVENKVIVGIYDKKISKKEEYKALVGMDII